MSKTELTLISVHGVRCMATQKPILTGLTYIWNVMHYIVLLVPMSADTPAICVFWVEQHPANIWGFRYCSNLFKENKNKCKTFTQQPVTS